MSEVTAEDAENAERLNELSSMVIGAAIEVNRELGPGLLESAYELCLCRELSVCGLAFERQLPVSIQYKGLVLDVGYRADIVVEAALLVEIKAVDQLAPIHDAQLLSYLRLGGWKLGLLINFNETALKRGIRRRVLNLKESSARFAFSAVE